MYRFSVLGTLSVEKHGRSVTLKTSMLRRLLAILLCRPNEQLPLDSLVDAMWDADPPETARKTLQIYIHRLRQAIGDPQRLQRTSGGYILVAKPGELDSTEFDQMVARAGDARTDLMDAAATYRQALSMWRGRAFEDATECAYVAHHSRLLHESRVQAVERYACVEFALNRPDRPIALLTDMIKSEPFHESLRGKLMLAYYRCGRQSDALAEFHDIRSLLVEQLAIEPGSDLARLHERILQNDPTLDVGNARMDELTPPAQLPMSLPSFVGREVELIELSEFEISTRGDCPRIVSISGMAGVGKTTLALRWSHNASHLFPDGQLCINLHGFGGSALSALEALRSILCTLGVAPECIPGTPEACAALFRGRVAGRRILLILDNARDTEQVKLLLPGSGNSLVIITSRHRLTGLVATHEAHPLFLRAFNEAESTMMFEYRLGAYRVNAERHAAEYIIDRCGRLPLALAIISAKLSLDPLQSLAEAASLLERAPFPLDEMSTDDPEVDVRAVLAWSYDALDPMAARVFRRLAVHPGPDFMSASVAALVGLSHERTHSILASLVRSNLLLEDHSGRFSLHDLLRAFATEQVGNIEREECIIRVLDYYLHNGHLAAMLLHPQRNPIVMPPRPFHVPLQGMSSREQAQSWLSSEISNLTSSAELALSEGHNGHAWRLAWTASDYLIREARWHDLAAANRVGLEAAIAEGNLTAQGHGHRYLRLFAYATGDMNLRAQHEERALTCFARSGNKLGLSTMYLDLAASHEPPIEMRAYAERALAFAREAENPLNEARALNSIAMSYVLSKEFKRAIEDASSALTTLIEADDIYGSAAAWGTLGSAQLGLHHATAAIGSFERALELYRRIGRHSYIANALIDLGDAHHAAGSHSAALKAWSEARQHLELVGQVREDLDGKLVQARV